MDNPWFDLKWTGYIQYPRIVSARSHYWHCYGNRYQPIAESSSTRKLDVKIPACPPEFAGSAGNAGAKGLSVDLKPVQSFTAELFPNPAINDFFIRINSPDKYSSVQIRVLDAQGKEMSRMKIMPEETISAGHLLQPGIYFIEMIQGVNRQVHKLIKQ